MTWACDFDGPSVYSEAEVVARKEHPCVECSAPILVGEKHLRYSGCWDGSWDGGRQHLLCRDACVWIRDVLNGECIPFGCLGEWWNDVGRRGDVLSSVTRRKWLIGARMVAMVKRRERLARGAA